nr:hypothetical protein [Chloroflexota bacterium]
MGPLDLGAPRLVVHVDARLVDVDLFTPDGTTDLFGALDRFFVNLHLFRDAGSLLEVDLFAPDRHIDSAALEGHRVVTDGAVTIDRTPLHCHPLFGQRDLKSSLLFDYALVDGDLADLSVPLGGGQLLFVDGHD